MVKPLERRRVVDSARVVLEPERQRLVAVGEEGQGEAGLFVSPELAGRPLATLRAKSHIELRGVEHDERIEERARCGHLAHRLDINEWQMLVPVKGDPVRAHGSQPRTHRHRRLDPDPDGDRGQEHPHHRLGTRNTAATGGLRSAEDNVGRRTVLREEERPCPEYEGVEGKPFAVSELPKALRALERHR